MQYITKCFYVYLKFVGLVIQCFCMTGPFGFLPLPNGSSDFHLNTKKVIN